MVSSLEDVEALLRRLDRSFQKVGDTLLVPLGINQPPAAIRLSAPVLVLQVEIGPTPSAEAAQLALFRKLLELNAQALLHSGYALMGDSVVLLSALELASLSQDEIEAVLADFDLALAEHVAVLRQCSEGTR